MVRLATAVGVTLCLSVTTARSAAADEKRECASSYERAQRLRRESKLVDAKRALVACVQEGCPQVLRTDCASWLKDVEAGIPTVVLEAREAGGAAVIDVEVTVDGSPLGNRLDGKAIEIDPGLHAFRFRREGAPAIEQSVMVAEGAKLQRVTATFKSTNADAVQLGPPPASERPAAAGRPWVLPAALGAVGVLALGSFSFFALSGRADENGTLAACRPDCAHDEVQAVSTKYLVADVSLVVATVSLGAAAIVWFSRR